MEKDIIIKIILVKGEIFFVLLQAQNQFFWEFATCIDYPYFDYLV